MLKNSPILQKVIVIAVAIQLVAFTRPVTDDLVELQAGLFARSEQKFRESDNNKVAVIEAKARGIIRKVKDFRDENTNELNGNSGVCIEFLSGLPKNAPKQDCYWVYFKKPTAGSKKEPALKLFGVANKQKDRESILAEWKGDKPSPSVVVVQAPKQAQIAETTKAVQAIPNEVVIAVTTAAPVAADMANSIQIADNSVRTIIALNNNSSLLMQPSLSCPDGSCRRPDPIVGESCSDKNSYQRSAIAQLLNSSSQSEYFNNPQKEVIVKSCIAKNMTNFSASSTYFRSCAPGQASGGRQVPRSCVDTDYINVTTKAFNLSAECLGDYVTGYVKTSNNPKIDSFSLHSRNIVSSAKQQAALSIFSFMSQESGMHINAQSGRGSGGPGQMTGGAIESVNNDLKNIRQHLANRTDNPNCSKVLLEALQKPLSTQGASCDRKDPKNIIQSMAYAFGYQAFIRRYLENTVFDKNVFGRVISSDLPIAEKDRLMMEVTAWAHNTGQGGMSRPLAALIGQRIREGKSIKTSADIDKFLKDLAPVVYNHVSSYKSEHANYYKNIQEKMAKIAPQGRSACLAN